MRKRFYRLFQWLYKGVPVIKVTPSIAYLSDENKLAGKKVLIIGGSRGVGFQIAKKCQECGASILIVGRNEETLHKASEALGNCPYQTFDIAKVDKVEEFLRGAVSAFGGPIDSLVFNASLYLHEHNISEVTVDGFDRQFTTNVKAPYFLAQHFLAYLEQNQINPANVLFISSEMGLYCNDVPYGLGKASLNSLVAGLSRRYITKGIRVNAIAPGVLSNEADGVSSDDLYRKYSCGQRFIMPEEVAEVAAFILSDAANCISGAVIPCNQGNHYRCDW